MEIIDRVRDLKDQKKLKNVDLASAFHVSEGYVSDFMSGKKKFSYEKVCLFCDYIGITVAEFFRPFGEASTSYEKYKEFEDLTEEDLSLLKQFAKYMKKLKVENDDHYTNVAGLAAAGRPINSVSEDDKVQVPYKYCDSSRYLIFRAKGDSMEPKIPNGSLVIAERESLPSDGEIAVVRVANSGDDEYTIKRVYKHPDGLELRSLNTKYPPMFYATNDVLSVERVKKVFNRQE